MTLEEMRKIVSDIDRLASHQYKILKEALATKDPAKAIEFLVFMRKYFPEHQVQAFKDFLSDRCGYLEKEMRGEDEADRPHQHRPMPFIFDSNMPF